MEKSAGTAADDNGSMHVQIILDRSGSMGPIALATVDAINGFLAKQRKQEGALRLSLVDFDSQEPFRIVADAVPIAEMMDLEPSDYDPRGGTPLLDAIGLGIERCTARTVADPEEDQLVVMITDGAENASTDFTNERIAKLVAAKREEGWTILFLGANQDSFATGADMNLSGRNVRDFQASDAGIKQALDMTSHAVSTQRDRSRSERLERNDSLLKMAIKPETQRRWQSSPRVVAFYSRRHHPCRRPASGEPEGSGPVRARRLVGGSSGQGLTVSFSCSSSG